MLPPALFKNVQGTHNIRFRVFNRVRDRFSHVNLSGEMEHELRLEFGKHLANVWALDIEFKKCRGWIDIVPFARGQVINHRHSVPFLEKLVYNVASDKSRSSCNDAGFHTV